MAFLWASVERTGQGPSPLLAPALEEEFTGAMATCRFPRPQKLSFDFHLFSATFIPAAAAAAVDLLFFF